MKSRRWRCHFIRSFSNPIIRTHTGSTSLLGSIHPAIMADDKKARELLEKIRRLPHNKRCANCDKEVCVDGRWVGGEIEHAYVGSS